MNSELSGVELARVIQFGDSAFPVGGFSFSCGLESAIQTKLVRCVDTLREFAATSVDQAARGDGIALIHAHRAASRGDVDALVDIDLQVEARKISEEARTMSSRMGRKHIELNVHLLPSGVLQDWLGRIESGLSAGCYPVVLGAVFAIQGLPERAAFVVHQYGVAATILGAALRLMKVSHIDTQRILYDVNAQSEKLFQEAVGAAIDDMAGFSPEADILAAYHTKAHVRLFMS
ncbi:MAG: urease accessory protein UreF [Beijerinckiaceae bacterium]